MSKKLSLSILVSFLLIQLSLAQNREELILKSEFLFQHNHTEEALTTLDSISEKTDYAYLLKGKILQEMDEHNAAINSFLKANQWSPNLADFGLAQSYASLEKYDSTTFFLKRHLKSSYKEKSNIIEQDVYLEAYRTSPFWKDFWQANFYSEAEKSVERAIYYKDKSELILALDILDEVLNKNKDNVEALYYRAQFVVLLNEDYKYAVNDLKKAIKINPQDDKLYRLLGDYYMHEIKYKKALEAYQKAHEIFPYELADRYKLAMAFYRNTDYPSAITYIYSFLSVDTRNVDAYKLAGLVYYDNEQYEKSIEVLTKALYIDSRRADLLVSRGKSYLEAEDYQRAGRDFNIALDLDSNNGEIWYYKGLAFLYQGKKDEACKYFTKASYLHYYRADEYLLKECSN